MVILEKELLVLMDKFWVSGKPVPQGSMKVINGHILHSQGSALALWRADVARNAQVRGYKPVEGAIHVSLTFVFRAPKSVKRPAPWVKPDLDKLIRAVLDGLTGVAYEDDSQVITITARKVYGDKEGAWIGIERSWTP